MRTRNTRHLWTLTFVVAIALIAGLAHAELRLPKVFGNNMVLQRDSAVPVWGWADPGARVTVQFADQTKQCVADAAGRWTVRLDAMPASAEGRTLTVTVGDGQEKAAFTAVLVGEVWLCSGQSNMQWSVNQSKNPADEIANARWPLIRHIAIPRVPSGHPRDDVDASWQICSPETAAGFSAVAYYFGRHLHRELNVPVGLIHSSWGGTRIEPWTPPEGFAAVPALAGIHEQVQNAMPTSPKFKARLGKYIGQVEAWMAEARKSIASGSPLAPIPDYPPELKPLGERQQPCALYNGMIHALVPYAIRGAIWYQGESNHTEGMLYYEKMKALIGGWRELWKRGDFPFYFVQIAPFQYGNESPAILPRLWEAQTAALAIPNTGMTVISDIGNLKDIHPKNKQGVGARLGQIALAKTYGIENIVYSGPMFKSMAIEGNSIRVTFDHVGGGLASRDGKPLSWFEIVGPDTDFVKADATIDGNAVVLSSPAVTNPAAVRFAWHKLAEPNLMNKEGLPANPFRAGEVPRRDWLALKVEEAEEYELVYSLDLAKLGKTVRYDIDNRGKLNGAFDRIAYFLELKKAGKQVRYLYVSMDAFSDDLSKIGIPTFASKAEFQQKVANMNVFSNADGIRTGKGIATGNIEFWPDNYGPSNSASVPKASPGVYDFGDQPTEPEDGYGSMQVHNYGAGQTLFAINKWKSGNQADIGIGNSAGRTRDWTFTSNAASYETKNLRVLVRMRKGD